MNRREPRPRPRGWLRSRSLRATWFRITLLATAGLMVATACNQVSVTTPLAASSSQAPTALHVGGVQLADAAGGRVVATGATDYLIPFYLGPNGAADPHLAATVAQDFANRDADFATMHKDGFNTVRVPLGVGTFSKDVYGLGGSAGYLQHMKDIVASAAAAHLYVIFCWWDVLQPPTPLAGLGSSLAIMHTVVNALRGDSNVIYEPVNEPHGPNMTWTAWQSAMTTIVTYWRSTIRYSGPLIIDTINYSWDFDKSQANTLMALDTRLLGSSSQILFANHRYANANTCFCGNEKTSWLQEVGDQASAYPLIGTEYGYYNGLIGGVSTYQPTWNAQLLQLLAKQVVPEGFNGAIAFVWHWIDTNNMTTDGQTLNANGKIYEKNFVQAGTGAGAS